MDTFFRLTMTKTHLEKLTRNFFFETEGAQPRFWPLSISTFLATKEGGYLKASFSSSLAGVVVVVWFESILRFVVVAAGFSHTHTGMIRGIFWHATIIIVGIK